jgi:lipopolysaccharide export system permease protein
VDNASVRDYAPLNAQTTWALTQGKTPAHWAELYWRTSLILSAFNMIWIGLATAGVNPRAGRSVNFVFAFLAFVVYFNLLILSKNWIEGGKAAFLPMLLQLHGGVFLTSMLWLLKRHNHWTFRLPWPRALRQKQSA